MHVCKENMIIFMHMTRLSHTPIYLIDADLNVHLLSHTVLSCHTVATYIEGSHVGCIENSC